MGSNRPEMILCTVWLNVTKSTNSFLEHVSQHFLTQISNSILNCVLLFLKKLLIFKSYREKKPGRLFYTIENSLPPTNSVRSMYFQLVSMEGLMKELTMTKYIFGLKGH